jgi:hypothetical protein
VNRKQHLNRFYLGDNPLLHKEIDAKTVVELPPIETECYAFLSVDMKTSSHKALLKQRFIDRFEQARSKSFVKVECRVDNCSRQFVQALIGTRCASIVSASPRESRHGRANAAAGGRRNDDQDFLSSPARASDKNCDVRLEFRPAIGSLV